MSRISSEITGNPFPGLRPFQEDEDYLFFGREGQIAELIKRLRESRFLAVVGTSGSGKSSLIRAGLVPALHRGAMVGAGANWEVVFTRPGSTPLENLARSLEQSDLYEPDADLLPRLLTCINRSRVGLVDAVKQAGLEPGANFLLIVDQFEEIFRFRNRDEESLIASAHFIASLLEATEQSDINFYVMLTMRSDYLGDCTLSWTRRSSEPRRVSHSSIESRRIAVDHRTTYPSCRRTYRKSVGSKASQQSLGQSRPTADFAACVDANVEFLGEKSRGKRACGPRPF